MGVRLWLDGEGQAHAGVLAGWVCAPPTGVGSCPSYAGGRLRDEGDGCANLDMGRVAAYLCKAAEILQ
jgi:hypothetical protein